MDTSVLLARLFGPLFVVVSIGLLTNRAHYSKMMENFLKDAGLYYFSGAIAFVVGMVLVLHHNLWVADWRVVITVIGWMSLFKGVGRIVFPNMSSKVAGSFAASSWTLNAGAVLVLIVGTWLSYEGFRS